MPTQTGEVAQERRQRLNEWVEQNPLRAWRKEKGYLAADLSQIATPNSFKNWERGHVRPSAEKMAELAAVMQMRQIDLEAAWTDWMNQRPL